MDFKRLSDMNFDPDVFALSADTLALCLSLVTTFPYRGQWMYDGNPVTDSQWDDIQAAVAFAYEELSDPYICPPSGGDTDYTLQDEITLSVDETTYTLEDLHLLDGRDLIIEFMGARDETPRGDLRCEINSISSSSYGHRAQRIQSSATFDSSTRAYIRLSDALAQAATPQLTYSYFQFSIPNWKLTDRYPVVYWHGGGDIYHFVGRVILSITTDVQTFAFIPPSAGLRAGTKIAVYTRGS